MRTSHIITGVALMAAFVMGCSKSSNSSSPSPIRDLVLSTNTPSHVSIDSSHDCTITTTALQNGQLLLRVDIRASSSVNPAPPVKVILSPGQTFTVQTKDMAAPFCFKAKLKAE
jgi:hypothetical protein